MSRRIIDHKRIEMTDAEWKMYETICRSYDRPNFKGEDLFADHFETNDHGIILMVKPPNKKFSSMEVFCFLVSLMVNQHLRLAQEQQQALVKETKDKVQELLNEVQELRAAQKKVESAQEGASE